VNIAAMMSAVNQLSQANPLVKAVVESLMGTMAKNPEAIQDISSAVEKIAELKSTSVEQLISGGGLARALLERFTQGKVVEEKPFTELQSMVCDGCGKVHFQLVEGFQPAKPAPVSQVA